MGYIHFVNSVRWCVCLLKWYAHQPMNWGSCENIERNDTELIEIWYDLLFRVTSFLGLLALILRVFFEGLWINEHLSFSLICWALLRMEQSRQIMFLAKWNIEHTFCDGSEFKKLITRCSLSPISLSKSHENYAINKEYCQLTPNPRNDNFRICISCNGRLLPLAILSAAVNCSQWCTKTITLIWKNQ